MTEQYKVIITPDGIKFEASGFKGDKCTATQEELEKFIKSAGIMTSGKDVKRKLELSYTTAPGNQVKY